MNQSYNSVGTSPDVSEPGYPAAVASAPIPTLRSDKAESDFNRDSADGLIHLILDYIISTPALKPSPL